MKCDKYISFSIHDFLFLWCFEPIQAYGVPLRVLRSHSLDTSHSVGFLWTSDQPPAETCT